jgi:hypothetical protein
MRFSTPIKFLLAVSCTGITVSEAVGFGTSCITFLQAGIANTTAFKDLVQTHICDKKCTLTLQNYYDLVREPFGRPFVQNILGNHLGRGNKTTAETNAMLNIADELAAFVNNNCFPSGSNLDLCQNTTLLNNCLWKVQPQCAVLMAKYAPTLVSLATESNCAASVQLLGDASIWAIVTSYMDNYAHSCP